MRKIENLEPDSRERFELSWPSPANRRIRSKTVRARSLQGSFSFNKSNSIQSGNLRGGKEAAFSFWFCRSINSVSSSAFFRTRPLAAKASESTWAILFFEFNRLLKSITTFAESAAWKPSVLSSHRDLHLALPLNKGTPALLVTHSNDFVHSHRLQYDWLSLDDLADKCLLNLSDLVRLHLLWFELLYRSSHFMMGECIMSIWIKDRIFSTSVTGKEIRERERAKSGNGKGLKKSGELIRQGWIFSKMIADLLT